MPKKTSAKDKENFLKIFENNNYYSIRKSCRETKIGKSTFYRWLNESKFKQRVKDIKTKRKERNINSIIKLLRMNRKISRLLRC